MAQPLPLVLNDEMILGLAQEGARQLIEVVFATFPDLRKEFLRQAASAAPAAKPANGSGKPPVKPGRHTPMSPEERKQVSRRMKRYWVKRRKDEAAAQAAKADPTAKAVDEEKPLVLPPPVAIS